MALAQEDIELIHNIVEKAIQKTADFKNANVRYEMDLRERTIRIEEELKHQRELMLEGFKQMEKRFEQVDKRFEQIDKRFEQIDKRFEQVEKRFEQIDKRFEQVEKRFEQIDKRFEQVEKRFESVDKHFQMITKRMDRFMFWSLGLTVSAALFVVNYLSP